MPSVGNWIGESTATAGGGDITLGGALAGHAPFSSQSGNQFYYSIIDGDDRESGIGSRSGATFSRDTVTATIVGGVYDEDSPSPIALSGTASIYCVYSKSAYVETLSGRRNAIINGNFDIWQRGTSHSGFSGYIADDRWFNNKTFSGHVVQQEAFTVGQTDVPGEPIFFSRTIVTSVANASAAVHKIQKIEDVRSFAGQTVTLSFWAKADSAKDIATEFAQSFGSGGSTFNTDIGVVTHSLTTSWQRFTATVLIDSIAGKTIGSDSSLHINFWYDAGSNADSRTNSLGQQSGTFDIAQVQLEPGTIATTFERLPIAETLALCRRYFAKVNYDSGLATTGLSCAVQSGTVAFGASPIDLTQFRVNPSVSFDRLSIQRGAGAGVQAVTGLSSRLQSGLNYTVASGLVLDQANIVLSAGGGPSSIEFDAEI